DPARDQGADLPADPHHRHGTHLSPAVEHSIHSHFGHLGHLLRSEPSAQMKSVTCERRASDMKAPAPPNSTPSMKSDSLNPNPSMVNAHAISRTDESRHTARSSSSAATPFLRNLSFIIHVAMSFIPGSAVNVSAIGTGMGIAGLPTGLIFTRRLK